MVLAGWLENDYHRREADYRQQIQKQQDIIAELQHDVYCLNNIINPIPPPAATEEEDPNVLVADDDGMEDVEEEVEPWEDDQGDGVSDVDSDHSEPQHSYSDQLGALDVTLCYLL